MERLNSNKQCTVGVFDSGIGGLNLLAECVRNMPRVNFIYFADNYAVPYGDRTEEDILRRVRSKFDIMQKIGVAAAAVACNTATAVCIDVLRRDYPFPVFGIQPAVKQAARFGGRCAVLCTPVTAASASLNNLINKYGNGKTFAVPCPNLAEFIESRAPEISESEIAPILPTLDADCVVLGCTHYTFIKKAIINRYALPIFDGIIGTADHLKKILGNCDHFSNFCGNVNFVGGDICKNYAIFKHLMKNYINE